MPSTSWLSAARSRRRLALLPIVFLGFLAAASPLAAQLAAPVLVEDFAPGSDPGSLRPANITAIGGLLYFAGEDAVHGYEPWVSDGTAAGTRRLADLCPGYCSSSPAGFTQLGDAVVFFANGDHRNGLYRVAGSEVEELVRTGDRVAAWARLGSSILFLTSSDFRLFRSDGTRQGTVFLRSFWEASCHQDPSSQRCSPTEEMRALGGAIYFTAVGQLYRLEEDGAARILSPLGSARELTALDGGRVVFRGCRGYQSDCRAYATDGTAEGTLMLESLEDGRFTEGAHDFLAWRGQVYFLDSSGRPISTDGTVAGTRAASSIQGDSIDLLAATADRLYYLSYESGTGSASIFVQQSDGSRNRFLVEGGLFEMAGQVGDKIFFTHGNAGGINNPGFVRLAFVDGAGFPAGGDLKDGYARGPGALLGGSLYFDFAPSPDHNAAGLWRSDGTQPGTSVVANAPATPRSGSPRPYPLGTGLVAEVDDLFNQTRLFRVEPASLASQPVAGHPLEVLAAGRNKLFLADSGFTDARAFAFDGATLEQLPLPARPLAGAVAEDDRYFFMTDAAPSQLLWESDGTAAGTHRLVDFGEHGRACSDYCGHLGAIAPSGLEHVFFFAESDGGGAGGMRLSLWDRTDQEKRILLDPAGVYPSPVPIPGGRAFFYGISFPTVQYRLFVSDGTAAGTRPFFAVHPAYSLGPAAVAGHRLYFVLYRFEGSMPRRTLWVSDFTAAGTHPLTREANVDYLDLVPAGDHLYFLGDDHDGRGLGFSDGTAAGTRWLDLPLAPDLQSGKNLVLDDQRLVFPAIGDTAGNELWISDGSRAGTYRLTDLNPGPAASSPRSFAQVGRRLFFQATDGATGFELWALDLPAPRPSCPADRLCLQNGRFEVAVVAHAPDGDFQGRRALAADESGVFTFFSPSNWEMLVKVLDGCKLNDAFWVFASAASDLDYTLSVEDRADGRVRTYRGASQPGLPLLDLEGFASCGLAPPEAAHSPASPPATAAARCADDSASFCLGPGGRYRARVEWSTEDGSGVGLPVPDGSADSGLFTFFSPSNWELMVKLLDGCAINGKRWVYAAGTTDAGWQLTVSDTRSSSFKVYRSPLGTPSKTLTDGAAFDCN